MQQKRPSEFKQRGEYRQRRGAQFYSIATDNERRPVIGMSVNAAPQRSTFLALVREAARA